METKVLSSGVRHSTLPESYVRPESERPRLSEVSQLENIPIIDLGCEDRARIVRDIDDACKNYGFFQVMNHGVPVELVHKMLEVAYAFFSLPLEEKLKLYSDDPAKTMRLSTSFSVNKETVHNWRDYLRLFCYPLDKYEPEWPSNPPHFKETLEEYCIEIRVLGLRLQELISEALGMEKEHIKDVSGERGQHMAVNYYPPCPEPDLTYGLPGYTDPNTLTILLQDLQVAGLQVLKDGKWIAVNPHPNAFVINIGDQLQALSNGRYKSVWHRAIVNADQARMSVASFLCPSDDAIISPAGALTNNGSDVVYRDYTYTEYYKKFWRRYLDQELLKMDTLRAGMRGNWNTQGHATYALMLAAMGTQIQSKYPNSSPYETHYVLMLLFVVAVLLYGAASVTEDELRARKSIYHPLATYSRLLGCATSLVVCIFVLELDVLGWITVSMGGAFFTWVAYDRFCLHNCLLIFGGFIISKWNNLVENLSRPTEDPARLHP